MANGFIQVPPDSTGKLIDTSEVVNSTGQTVQRHRINLTDPVTVSAMAPVTSSGGLLVTLSSGSGGGVFASTGRQYLSFVFNSSSSNSLTIVTTAPAIFYGWNVGNQGTSASASIKVFNTSSGTVGSTAQLTVTIPIPGGSAGAGNNHMLPQGVSCTGGITIAITANFAATSTGSVAAGDVVGTLYYNV